MGHTSGALRSRNSASLPATGRQRASEMVRKKKTPTSQAVLGVEERCLQLYTQGPLFSMHPTCQHARRGKGGGGKVHNGRLGSYDPTFATVAAVKSVLTER